MFQWDLTPEDQHKCWGASFWVRRIHGTGEYGRGRKIFVWIHFPQYSQQISKEKFTGHSNTQHNTSRWHSGTANWLLSSANNDEKFAKERKERGQIEQRQCRVLSHAGHFSPRAGIARSLLKNSTSKHMFSKMLLVVKIYIAPNVDLQNWVAGIVPRVYFL